MSREKVIETTELIGPGHDCASLSDKIGNIVLEQNKTPKVWLLGAAVAFGILNLLMLAIGMLFTKGIGIWGINLSEIL